MFRIPRRLESPNKWIGRHWRTKQRITVAWEWELRAISPCGSATVRRRVDVERHVPSARHFIRDEDNLRFTVKPLLDALKRQRWIVDDARTWLELGDVTQHVATDGKDWTIVKVSEA
jgi:hypothetical protein